MSQPSPLFPAWQRAQALADAGDLVGARAMLERAVELGKVNLSEDDPDVLVTAYQLGSIMQKEDDPTAARRVLEEAYAAGQWRLGDSDPLILQISHDLGVVAEELGNRHEARKAFGRVVELGPAALGAQHPAVARARAYLGQDQNQSPVRGEAPHPEAPATSPWSLPREPPPTPGADTPTTQFPRVSDTEAPPGADYPTTPIRRAPSMGTPGVNYPTTPIGPVSDAGALRTQDHPTTTIRPVSDAGTPPDQDHPTTTIRPVSDAGTPPDQDYPTTTIRPVSDAGTPPDQDYPTTTSRPISGAGRPNADTPGPTDDTATIPIPRLPSASEQPTSTFRAIPLDSRVEPPSPANQHVWTDPNHSMHQARRPSPIEEPTAAQPIVTRRTEPMRMDNSMPGYPQPAHPVPYPAPPARRGVGLFAAIAAVLAAVIAVTALVFVLANRSNQNDDSDVPTLGGSPPADVRLRDEGTRIRVTWTDPTDGTVSFMVAMAHPGEQLRPVGTLGPGTTSYEMSSLNATLEYCFAVIAVYGKNKFATSEQACTDRAAPSSPN